MRLYYLNIYEKDKIENALMIKSGNRRVFY